MMPWNLFVLSATHPKGGRGGGTNVSGHTRPIKVANWGKTTLFLVLKERKKLLCRILVSPMNEGRTFCSTFEVAVDRQTTLYWLPYAGKRWIFLYVGPFSRPKLPMTYWWFSLSTTTVFSKVVILKRDSHWVAQKGNSKCCGASWWWCARQILFWGHRNNNKVCSFLAIFVCRKCCSTCSKQPFAKTQFDVVPIGKSQFIITVCVMISSWKDWLLSFVQKQPFVSFKTTWCLFVELSWNLRSSHCLCDVFEFGRLTAVFC